jgi:hypothetical protein
MNSTSIGEIGRYFQHGRKGRMKAKKVNREFK